MPTQSDWGRDGTAGSGHTFARGRARATRQLPCTRLISEHSTSFSVFYCVLTNCVGDAQKQVTAYNEFIF